MIRPTSAATWTTTWPRSGATSAWTTSSWPRWRTTRSTPASPPRPTNAAGTPRSTRPWPRRRSRPPGRSRHDPEVPLEHQVVQVSGGDGPQDRQFGPGLLVVGHVERPGPPRRPAQVRMVESSPVGRVDGDRVDARVPLLRPGQGPERLAPAVRARPQPAGLDPARAQQQVRVHLGQHLPRVRLDQLGGGGEPLLLARPRRGPAVRAVPQIREVPQQRRIRLVAVSRLTGPACALGHWLPSWVAPCACLHYLAIGDGGHRHSRPRPVPAPPRPARAPQPPIEMPSLWGNRRKWAVYSQAIARDNRAEYLSNGRW